MKKVSYLRQYSHRTPHQHQNDPESYQFLLHTFYNYNFAILVCFMVISGSFQGFWTMLTFRQNRPQDKHRLYESLVSLKAHLLCVKKTKI